MLVSQFAPEKPALQLHGGDSAGIVTSLIVVKEGDGGGGVKAVLGKRVGGSLKWAGASCLVGDPVGGCVIAQVSPDQPAPQ